ncbi:MAG: hypothetical protein FOGNACKC_00830 [Anaerolineae bacterium]|nr:hypothetical protein [Anaerolineae bacterium]
MTVKIKIMRRALEKIRDVAKSWEGRKEAPYWNLGDIAAAALKATQQGAVSDASSEDKKDLEFLREMLDRFVRGCNGDVTELEYVKRMMEDWIEELESETG